MFFQRYKFRIISVIVYFVAISSHALVSCQSSPIQNPHAVNLQRRFDVEVDNSGKAQSIAKAESIPEENIWQTSLSNARIDHPNNKDSSNSLEFSRFPTRFMFDQIPRYPMDSSWNHNIGENEKVLPKFLWDAYKFGRYAPPVGLKDFNHVNGWKIKPGDEMVHSNLEGLFEDRNLFNHPLTMGDLSQSRNINGPKDDGNLNSDFFQNPVTLSNDLVDLVQKRNNNAGFICHFKLCQLGASGKRRFNPGQRNFKAAHDYE